ncbi:uncharacterized protein [Panulirus ornatus]|uniref:uncharacterized protein n=1 Tax=Panulirus ornatus TaxID=150431 RepID=UPI003A8C2C1D
MLGLLGAPSSSSSLVLLQAAAVVVVGLLLAGVEGSEAPPSGSAAKEDVALGRQNNVARPSYTLFIKPMRRLSTAPLSITGDRRGPAAVSSDHSPLPSTPAPLGTYLESYVAIADSVLSNDATGAHSDTSVNNPSTNVTMKNPVGLESGLRESLVPEDLPDEDRDFRHEPDASHEGQRTENPARSTFRINPGKDSRSSSSNRGLQWIGRRSTESDDYLLQEEEVLEGVDHDDPEALLPDPTGPAMSILEKRLQHSSIRHRKSRRNFVRTRKSPKMRPRSHVSDHEGEQRRISEGPGAADFQITWESEAGELQQPDADIMADEFLGSTPTAFPWSSSGAPNLENKFRATGDLVPTGEASATEEEEESAPEQEKKQGSEADVDVVTKFLRIVESQHLLGENCTKGTDFNLGEGVVDRYAQERFRLEGEIAVNRANLYTRLWKYSAAQVLASEYLLHAEVLTMVELDEDIFAAGNCYDKYEYEDYILFCPFAYRLPEGTILVKDLAVEYKYLSNTSEWFFIARKNAERAIRNHTHLTKGYHTYKWNSTAHTARVQEEILSVTYEDGRWSKPYFDCGGGNIWMMTYTVPFFGYANGTYYFKGTSGIDIDLRRVDIDQCPLPPGSTALNIFANSDKCKKRTTKCITIPGLGFRRGSYKCECRVGFYFPDTDAHWKYYNGSVIEEEYEKKIVGEFSTYDEEGSFECLPCAEGCETCEDASPCVVSLNWLMRTAILTLSIIIILSLPVIVVFTWKYGNIKVVRAASPALLRIIILGAFFIYSTTLVLYPIPTLVTCSLRVWLREIGFSLAYGALMLKTWRISVIFRVRSAKAVKITDLDLMKRLGVIVGVFAAFLAIRTVVAPPQVIVSMTADDLKAFLCSTDWWDHAFTAMEMMFLVWGIRLCIMVRKAPSEFNESRFISMAIYNEFLLSLFLNVSMLFLQSPANPDLLFIIFFCHTQLTITLLIALIFGSKAYLVVKGQGKGEESISMTKPMAAKFLQRPHAANSHNLVHTSSSDHADLQEEFRRLYVQLESLRERNLRLGNRQMVAKITAMKDAANLPSSCSSSTPAPQPPPITAVVVTEKNLGSAADQQQQQQQKRPSRRDRNYSDGIVMKPYVNNILANMTDKIVCATFHEELTAPPPSAGALQGEGSPSSVGPYKEGPLGARGKDPNLRNSVSHEDNIGSGERRVGDVSHLKKSASSREETIECADDGRGRDANPLKKTETKKPTDKRKKGKEVQLSRQPDCQDSPGLPNSPDSKASPPIDYVRCNSSDASSGSADTGSVGPRDTRGAGKASGGRCVSRGSQSSSSQSSSSSSSDAAAKGSYGSKDLKPVGYRSAEFLLRKSVSTELSERFCRSLEYLDDGGSRCGGSAGGTGGCGAADEDLSLEDRSVRSAHSTPRRSQGRRFREVRDPERARAFILHSLSDRATLTDEVTV